MAWHITKHGKTRYRRVTGIGAGRGGGWCPIAGAYNLVELSHPCVAAGIEIGTETGETAGGRGRTRTGGGTRWRGRSL